MDNAALCRFMLQVGRMPTIKKHQSQRCAASQRTPEENTVQGNNSRMKREERDVCGRVCAGEYSRVNVVEIIDENF